VDTICWLSTFQTGYDKSCEVWQEGDQNSCVIDTISLAAWLNDYTFGMGPLYRKKIGNWGETLVLEHLQSSGYTLVERNYHCRYGEADLIMLDETGLLTCVEVKTRRSQKFGPAEYSVGRKKLKALSETMNAFLYEHTEFPEVWNLDLAVVEDFIQGEPPLILHFRSVRIDD
jgi:putative endonuclease